MKMRRQLGYQLLSALVASSAFAENKAVDTRIGKLEFTHDFANGYPTKETVEKLYDERDFQRAQVVVTEYPADLGRLDPALHEDLFELGLIDRKGLGTAFGERRIPVIDVVRYIGEQQRRGFPSIPPPRRAVCRSGACRAVFLRRSRSVCC